MALTPVEATALVGWLVLREFVAFLVYRDARPRGRPYAVAWAVAVVLLGALGILAYAAVERRRGEATAAGDDDGSVWDLIPRWQYGSFHHGYAGGHAREVQERAIEGIERQAARLGAVRGESETRREDDTDREGG